MSAQDIKTAIMEVLAVLWPERTVYPDTCPDDHDRPSALVQILSADPTPANAGMLKRDAKFLVVLWGELDGYALADEETLTDDQEKVMAALGVPLAVGDRHLLLLPSAQGYDLDDGAAFVEVTTSWFGVWTRHTGTSDGEQFLMENFQGKFDSKRSDTL